MRNASCFRALVAAVLVPAAAWAQGSVLDTTAIDDAVRSEMRATRAPGVAIAVMREGRVVYAKGYGVRSIEENTPVTPETVFRIGSVTKVFTGLTALLMAREGAVDIEAPLGRYARGLHASLASLTLRELLTHTAGIVGEATASGPHDDAALGVRVRAWRGEHRFAPAGDIYSYTGAGYWLAGYALEQAGGAWYADLVTRHVLDPLGMRRSMLRPLVAMTYPLALDHRVQRDSATVLRPYADDASTWPSGSLFSTVLDLARFATALMDGGRVDGRRVLPPEVLAPLLTRQVLLPGGTCGYSYGLSICDRGGVRTVSHYGFRVGSGAVFTMIPATRSAVIILANRNGGIFGATERAVLSQLAGPGESPGSGAPQPVALTGDARRRYAGLYVNGPDTLRFVVRADSLFYRYGSIERRVVGGGPDEVLVLDEDGSPAQAFRATRGSRAENVYLHDGISAFRRLVR